MKDLLGRGVNWIAMREPFVVLFLAPWLLFPSFSRVMTILALAILPLLWGNRLLAKRPFCVRTPLSGPLLLLLVALIPAVWFSPLSPKGIAQATSFLLGVGLFFALTNCEPKWRKPEVAGVVLLAVGAVMAVLGLVGTEWGEAKVTILGRVTERLPRLLTSGSSLTGNGFAPDVMGGLMALLLPVVIAFMVLAGRRGRHPLMDRWQGLAWLGGAIALLMVVLLLLTQSRTAVLVLVLVGGMVLGVRRRGVGVIMLALLIVASILLLIGLLSSSLTDWMVSLDRASRSVGTVAVSWLNRVEIWQNALKTIRDYPVVGSGIGAFEQVSWYNYAYATVRTDYPLDHAHNLWLQAGVDLGLVGLFAFGWMTLILLLLGWAVRRRHQSEEGILLTGIWLGLLAWMGHGFMNAIALGSRPALIVWVMIGILVGSWPVEEELPAEGNEKEERKSRALPWPGLIMGLVLLLYAAAFFSGSSAWSLNRGAILLDRVALKDNTVSDSELDESQALPEAIELLESASSLPGSLRRQALAHYEAGNTMQAIVLFQQDEEVESYLVSRVRQMIYQERFAEAQDFLSMGLSVMPSSGRLTCLAGDTYRLGENLSRAWEFYQQMPEMAPSFGEHLVEQASCFYQLGLFEKQRGSWEAAARSFGLASNLDPEQPAYPAEYGWALFQATGELAEPVAIEEAILEKDPGAVPVMLILADMYLQADRPQKSFEWSENAVAVAPMETKAWLRLAQAEWALGQPEAALQALDQVLRLDPGNVRALALQSEWRIP